MKQWNDPRVAITFLLILLFGFAYVNDPADDAMKGALIAAFAAAYGYWIGAAKSNEQASANTGAAFAAIEATAKAKSGDMSVQADSVTVEERP